MTVKQMQLKEKVFNAFRKGGSEKSFLLALSGGLDSVALFHLMLELGLNFSAAHVNYGLRGKDSEKDAEFVRDLCNKNGIKFYYLEADVPAFKENNNDSTQSAARKIRYEWFEELMAEQDVDFLVTAHHLGDSAETFFINLLRGTGLRGLTGIEESKHVIRPLLNSEKKEILEFALKNGINWREDASNRTDDYIRNRIRNYIILELEKINPGFLQQFHMTTKFLKHDSEIIKKYIDDLRQEIFIQNGTEFHIPLNRMRDQQNDSVIYYLFQPFGFNHPQEIIKLFDSTESAEIRSAEYRLIKNRESLILKQIEKGSQEIYFIKEPSEITHPVHLKFTLMNFSPALNLPSLDYDKLKFPLSLRLRQTGDVFYPKGMGGKSKKVSKFFKDLKLSQTEKEKTWLLCDATDRIIWIVGKRFDERFLPTKDTTQWLLPEKLD